MRFAYLPPVIEPLNRSRPLSGFASLGEFNPVGIIDSIFGGTAKQQTSASGTFTDSLKAIMAGDAAAVSANAARKGSSSTVLFVGAGVGLAALGLGAYLLLRK